MSFKPNKNIFGEIEGKVILASSLAVSELMGDIRDAAPVDTGKMRDSIEMSEIGDVIRVEVGVDYASDVEFGTKNKAANPFVRTTISQNKISDHFEDIL